MLLINIMLSRFLILMQRKSDPWLLPTIINVLIVLKVINSISWLRRTTSIIIYNYVHCAMVLIAKGYPFLHLACTIGSRYIIMLILSCIVPFRISYNFLHYAPNSMYYSETYSQDYCQNSKIALETLCCNT